MLSQTAWNGRTCQNEKFNFSSNNSGLRLGRVQLNGAYSQSQVQNSKTLFNGWSSIPPKPEHGISAVNFS